MATCADPHGLMHGAGQHRAVTFVEMLTVVAVITLLLALLVPSLSAARERARRMICANNERQWGVALQMYRDDFDGYIPTEGTYWDMYKPYTWFNVLPPYFDAPRYVDVEGQGDAIKEFPAIHVWICPSKNLTDAFKSSSGKNQIHYGMNQVLDGMGDEPDGSDDTPGFFDLGDMPLRASRFAARPNTVFLFDIAPNSPAGSPRQVANERYRSWDGGYVGRFHGNFANFLFLDGHVADFRAEDYFTDGDYEDGDIIWTNPNLYWGYLPSAP